VAVNLETLADHERPDAEIEQTVISGNREYEDPNAVGGISEPVQYEWGKKEPYRYVDSKREPTGAHILDDLHFFEIYAFTGNTCFLQIDSAATLGH
jgi:hypothetical protein